MCDNSLRELLQDVSIPSSEEYVKVCEVSLIDDLQHVYANYSDVISIDDGYKGARKSIIREIENTVKSQILCESAIDNSMKTNCSSCTACKIRAHTTAVVENLRNKKCSNVRYHDPIFSEFWTSYFPIVEKIVNPESKCRLAHNAYLIFQDSEEKLYRRIVFFNTLVQCYHDIIMFYTNRASADMTDWTNLMSYLTVCNFMDRYSKLLTNIAIYFHDYNLQASLICNFKRWWRIFPAFKTTIVTSPEYVFLNGIANMIKRKYDMSSSDIVTIMTVIVKDYIRIRSGKEDESGSGETGFLVSCRLGMPSMIDAFRPFVSDDTIRGVMDPIKLGDSKTQTIKRLTTKKIVRFLKKDI